MHRTRIEYAVRRATLLHALYTCPMRPRCLLTLLLLLLHSTFCAAPQADHARWSKCPVLHTGELGAASMRRPELHAMAALSVGPSEQQVGTGLQLWLMAQTLVRPATGHHCAGHPPGREPQQRAARLQRGGTPGRSVPRRSHCCSRLSCQAACAPSLLTLCAAPPSRCIRRRRWLRLWHRPHSPRHARHRTS